MSKAGLSVAILGASRDRAKFGNKAVRAFTQAGYVVYPVNPKGGEIEGLQVSTSLAEVPATQLDCISIYLPSSVSLGLLDEIVNKGCRQLWLNPGADSPQLIAAAEALGLTVKRLCSIVALGYSPSQFPDG